MVRVLGSRRSGFPSLAWQENRFAVDGMEGIRKVACFHCCPPGFEKEGNRQQHSFET